MTKFPSENELLAYCESLGIKANRIEHISPPDYRFKFHWNLPKGHTDDVIKKTFYSTTLASNDDVLGFIDDIRNQDVTSINYHYFNSKDALDGEIILYDHETLFNFFKTRSIGKVELGSYDYSDGKKEVLINGQQDDSTWEMIKIQYKDLSNINDDELWMIFLWMIAKGQLLEKHYNIDHFRTTDYLRLSVSRQRFATGTHVIAYDNFDHEVRDNLLSSLRDYLSYFKDTKNKPPIRLTIGLKDPDAPSGKKAVEFIDKSASQEEIGLNVSFGEYYYVLMSDNLERFNKVYKDLVNQINTNKEELAAYILSDGKFAKCGNQKLRQNYIENLLKNEEFQKYKPCFQLTDLNDWLEQRHFTDELYTRVRLLTETTTDLI